MANTLPAEKAERLCSAFAAGKGVRAAAREAGCHRDTAMRFRRRLIEATLQLAYDHLWDGDCEKCDELLATVPQVDAMRMLDAWQDDQDGKEPKSEFYGR